MCIIFATTKTENLSIKLVQQMYGDHKRWRQEKTQGKEDAKCFMYMDCVELLLCFIRSFPVSCSRLDCQPSSRVEGSRQVALGQGYTHGGQPARGGGAQQVALVEQSISLLLNPTKLNLEHGLILDRIKYLNPLHNWN